MSIFGVACLASAYSSNLSQLTVLRFLTGFGLGAAMPNAVTMMSEFCPDHRRSTVTNLMWCGFPLGAAFGGFLAAWMIPQFGWRSVLILGGVSPLILVGVMLLVLPESVRYLVAKGRPAQDVRNALARVSQSVMSATSFVMTERSEHAGTRKTGLALVLSRPFLVGSLMLWLTFFMGLVIFYALINWMPILLKDAGIAPRTATLISALFPLGGVGAVAFGLLMDRFNANRIIMVGYALTALAVFAIGRSIGSVGWLVVFVFLGGVLMNTAQSSMPALAAAFYPTQGRATGVAWMLGIGRFGGIAGSFLVAELTLRKFAFDEIFTIVAVAGVVSTVALVVKQFVHPEPEAPADRGAATVAH